MEIVNIPIIELKEAEYNPRKMTEKQVKDLTESMKKFGFAEPIVVNNHPTRKNVIVGGHQRVKIARILGIKEIPCVYVDLEEKEEKELNLRLNKNNGEWDWDMLANFDESMLLEVGFEESFIQGGVDSDLYNSNNTKDQSDPMEISHDEIQRGLNNTCPKCGYKF